VIADGLVLLGCQRAVSVNRRHPRRRSLSSNFPKCASSCSRIERSSFSLRSSGARWWRQYSAASAKRRGSNSGGRRPPSALLDLDLAFRRAKSAVLRSVNVSLRRLPVSSVQRMRQVSYCLVAWPRQSPVSKPPPGSRAARSSLLHGKTVSALGLGYPRSWPENWPEQNQKREPPFDDSRFRAYLLRG
jgi:hypothetical protein